MEGLADSLERRLQLEDERLTGACVSEREYTLLVLPLLRCQSFLFGESLPDADECQNGLKTLWTA